MRLSGFIANDKESETSGQRNDCTVRALSTVTGRDYVEVLNVLREAGRKDNKGFHLKAWLKKNNWQVLGHWFQQTMGIQDYGVYLCAQVGHVWAIKNGVKYDYAGSRHCKCNEIWLVTKLHETEYIETKAEKAAKQRIAMIMKD